MATLHIFSDDSWKKSKQEPAVVYACSAGGAAGMREGITVEVSAADRARWQAIVADRNSPQKHVWRAWIVLLTPDGLGTQGG